MELVSLAEAARRLNISPSAVRRRIYSGQLRARKETTPQGHVWFVELDDSMGPVQAAEPEDEGVDGEVAALRELVDALRDQSAVLQQQLDRRETELEARRREVAELHVLLQQAQRQLPAPPAASPPGQGTARRRFWPWGGKT